MVFNIPFTFALYHGIVLDMLDILSLTFITQHFFLCIL